MGFSSGYTNPMGTGRGLAVWLHLRCSSVGGVGGELVFFPVSGSGRGWWCYVSVCCESGLFLLMAGPGICILC